jgi:hypothetical protein
MLRLAWVHTFYEVGDWATFREGLLESGNEGR